MNNTTNAPERLSFSVLYWQTPCVCGFQAKSAAEWQRHGIVYQGCGKGSAPFQHHRKQRKPNASDQTPGTKDQEPKEPGRPNDQSRLTQRKPD